LLYLAYTPLEAIPLPDQVKLAFDVGIAALVGNNVYNFGELLQHPIVQVLRGTEHAWLGELLFAFNAGDIKTYQTVAEEKAVNSEVLVKNAAELNRKIRIMAVMEMVFRRPSEERTISFVEISKECQLPVPEVELLLMQAFSRNVIKGVIDQVDQNVRVTWVQPRVLDKTQIANLRDRLLEWSKEVHQVAIYVEQNGGDVIHKH